MRRIISAFSLVTALLGSAWADSGKTTITLLHTDDFHAHLEPVKVKKGKYGGYARQATLIKKYLAEDVNPLVLSGGDTFQGTLYYNVYKGMADVLFMNYMKYDAMAVGNHEFDDGPEVLARFIEKADFPVLAANLDVSKEPSLKDKIKPYTVLTVGGHKIGVIGAVTPDLPLISSPGPTVKMLDLMDSLKAGVKALKDQGINKIFLVSHLGYPLEQEVAKTVPGIDVIVSGHSHTLLGKFDNPDFPKSEGPYPTVINNPDGNKTLLVATWEWGKILGRLKIDFDTKGAVTKWEGGPIVVSENIAEDPVAKSMIETLKIPVANLRQEIVTDLKQSLDGSREIVRKRESTMANVIADAALSAAKNANAELALVNGGGVRASMNAGPLSFEEAITVQPFGNTLVILDLTGKQLKTALEHGVSKWSEGKGQFLHVSKGMAYTFDLSKPVGNRVTKATLNDKPLEDTKVYKVATNNFIAAGGDGFAVFKDVKKLETGTLDIDILVDYLKKNKNLNYAKEGRIVVENEPKTKK